MVLRSLLPSLLATLVLATGSASARAGQETVASLPPVALLVEAVMGDHVATLGGGGHAHGGSLRPTGRRALDDADLVFWIGPALEPALADLASDGVALGSVPGVARRTVEGGASDPHVWLSPDNALAMLAAIESALAERDAEGAERYRSNRKAAEAAIADAVAEIRAALDPLAGRSYVVEHDAYGHFADAMGLAPAIALSPGDGPAAGARRLREVAREAEASRARCLIVEPGSGGRLARTLGLRAVEIDPLGMRAETYPDLLRAVAQGFADCLGG